MRIAVLTGARTHGWYDFLSELEGLQARQEVEVELHDIPLERGTPKDTARAIRAVLDVERPFDLLAIVRGGGDTEKLQRFSNPVVVEAVATVASVVPTIVAIGHDRDVIAAQGFGFDEASAPAAAGRRAAHHVTEMRKRTHAAGRTVALAASATYRAEPRVVEAHVLRGASPSKAPYLRVPAPISQSAQPPASVATPEVMMVQAVAPRRDAAQLSRDGAIPVSTRPRTRRQLGWGLRAALATVLVAALGVGGYFVAGLKREARPAANPVVLEPREPVLVETGSPAATSESDAGPARSRKRDRPRVKPVRTER